MDIFWHPNKLKEIGFLQVIPTMGMINVDMLIPPGHGRTTSVMDEESSSVKGTVGLTPKKSPIEIC